MTPDRKQLRERLTKLGEARTQWVELLDAMDLADAERKRMHTTITHLRVLLREARPLLNVLTTDDAKLARVHKLQKDIDALLATESA